MRECKTGFPTPANALSAWVMRPVSVAHHTIGMLGGEAERRLKKQKSAFGLYYSMAWLIKFKVGENRWRN
jgi:hypothetical protein